MTQLKHAALNMDLKKKSKTRTKRENYSKWEKPVITYIICSASAGVRTGLESSISYDHTALIPSSWK